MKNLVKSTKFLERKLHYLYILVPVISAFPVDVTLVKDPEPNVERAVALKPPLAVISPFIFISPNNSKLPVFSPLNKACESIRLLYCPSVGFFPVSKYPFNVLKCLMQ